MSPAEPQPGMTVAEILEHWPETVSVFQEFRTACVGCVMAPFDTMADVAQIYELQLDELMTALNRTVSQTSEGSGQQFESAEHEKEE